MELALIAIGLQIVYLIYIRMFPYKLPDFKTDVFPEEEFSMELNEYLKLAVQKVPDDAVIELATFELIYWDDELRSLGHDREITEKPPEEDLNDDEKPVYLYYYQATPEIKDKLIEFIGETADQLEKVKGLAIYHKDILDLDPELTYTTDYFRKNRTIYIEFHNEEADNFTLETDGQFKEQLKRQLKNTSP